MLAALVRAAAGAGPSEFAIKDGDTVVFLGDSITAARTYGKIIENYTLLRFPDRRVSFYNAGKGGDTARGCLERLDRDVFRRGATLVTVAVGMNDIGWGMLADAAHKREYLDGIRGIIERCQQRGVRVFICSAAIGREEDPDQGERGFLQRMCDEAMAMARTMGAGAIDVQREMRKVLRRVIEVNKHEPPDKKTALHLPDGVHLTELGQLAMAFAILKGLGAPADVPWVTVDAAGPALLEAKGCKVTGLKRESDTLQFDRLDDGLPINFGFLAAFNYRFVPIPDQLGRYGLTVKNLPRGQYEIIAAGRLVGRFNEQQFAAGLNISTTTPDPWQPGGPWDAQWTALAPLTEARDHLMLSRFYAHTFMEKHPQLARMDEQVAAINEKLQTLQRAVAAPVPYRFVIRPAKQ
ncbi:MAG: GDSL-type esterase/lipase family protein [Verrucomicrobiae bacterium]|nr:GDSL-type esterase/lipase family protein [Verrucomicrobiae bacterium]